MPPDPITSVRSFKVEFGSRVVGPSDTLDFFFSMTTPGTVPPGAFAYNSFAYQADRADGLGSLAAEPQKVGVSLGSCDAASLGDFVWVDANRNGIQDDGPTGLNGVYIRLFTPGPDGVPGTPDDVPLSSTITSDGPGNAPGWYRFPGLAPGSYFVCFTPPPTFDVTTPNQGSDASDSDANPATGCTPVVTLAANQDDPDLDLGLIATQLAALGDYVWFDRNSDGVQNESPFDGVNGVTVRLFLDNGDGNARAGRRRRADGDHGHRRRRLRPAGLLPVRRPDPGPPLLRPVRAARFGDRLHHADRGRGHHRRFQRPPHRRRDGGGDPRSGRGEPDDRRRPDHRRGHPRARRPGLDGHRQQRRLRAAERRDGDRRRPPRTSISTPTATACRRSTSTSGTTTSSTVSGFAGRYRFTGLAPGNYIVVVDPGELRRRRRALRQGVEHRQRPGARSGRRRQRRRQRHSGGRAHRAATP